MVLLGDVLEVKCESELENSRFSKSFYQSKTEHETHLTLRRNSVRQWNLIQPITSSLPTCFYQHQIPKASSRLSKYLERVSRWWSQKSSAAAWWSHFYTRPYTRSSSKGQQPPPRRYRHSSVILRDKFQEHWWKSRRKWSAETLSWLLIFLETLLPFTFTSASPSPDSRRRAE